MYRTDSGRAVEPNCVADYTASLIGMRGVLAVESMKFVRTYGSSTNGSSLGLSGRLRLSSASLAFSLSRDLQRPEQRAVFFSSLTAEYESYLIHNTVAYHPSKANYSIRPAESNGGPRWVAGGTPASVSLLHLISQYPRRGKSVC